MGLTEAPRSWTRFERRYGPIAEAYDTLRTACREAGPLEDGAIALAKLAISVGANCGRSVHIHAKKALKTGVPSAAVRQVAILALPTIGLPRAMEALNWIDESIEESR
jgi:alkylhydroperoxidase/carboxymuconolactone decarboxylase family protein YurZ